MPDFRIRKINLNDLPRVKGKTRIDWDKSIGKSINFQYDDVVGFFKILSYNKPTRKLSVDYNGDIYKISRDSILNCRLGNMLKKHTDDFRLEVGEIIKNDKMDIMIINREYRKDNKGVNRKWYKYKCNKCPNEDWIEESNLLSGRGCNVCCYPSKKVLIGYNDLNTTNPEIVKYFLNEDDAYKYSNGSGKRIKVKCPDCGCIKEIAIYDLIDRGFSCKKCSHSKSYSEKFMTSLLEQLSMDFIPEYSPEWLNGRRFDFYIPLMQLIIEMDGAIGHGYKDNLRNGTTKEELKEIDKWKDEQASIHNLKVIRINCNYNCVKNRFNYIKTNVLNSELNNLLNLNNINWDEVEKFSTANIIKMVCDKKNENPNITTNELMKIFKLSRTTILEYLKIGDSNGWCKFNPQSYRMKPVKVFKNDEFLGIYESAKFISENSEDIFGIKLTASSIGKVCRNEMSTYLGFKFEYVGGNVA